MVYPVARSLHRQLPRIVTFDDLVGPGMLGLVNAIEKYKPSRSVTFKTFARFHIRGAMLDYLRSCDYMSRQDRTAFKRIEKARRELGENASTAEIAAHLGDLEVKQVDRLLALATIAIHSVSQHPEVAERPDHSLNPEAVLRRSELRDAIQNALDQINPRHAKVLKRYYFEGWTDKRIGAELGVRESRVCQIRHEAIATLREILPPR